MSWSMHRGEKLLVFLTGVGSIGFAFYYHEKLGGALFLLICGIGVFATALGFGVLYEEGIEIDEKNKRVRAYKSFMTIKNGQWESLSVFNRIIFREYSFVTKRKSATGGIFSTEKGKEYQVYLAGKPGKTLKLYVSSDKKRMQGRAEYLADALGLSLQEVYH